MEIELRTVSKRFGSIRALQSIDVHLRSGELLLVTGPNGSGKTTLLRILATALFPDDGDYLWNGQPVHKALDQARQSIGFLPERMGLYEDLTVQENLIFWSRVYGQSSTTEKFFAALKLWQLEAYRSRPASTLSQGMVRRTGLAKITMQSPKLILLDEPFNGLDEENTSILVRTLGEWKGEGKAMAIATHQPETLAFMEDRRLSLEKQGNVYDVPTFSAVAP